MDEARRFVRYIMPGIVFILEVLIFLSISDPNQLKCFIKNIGIITSHEGIGLIVVTLLSGGLGYIFSNVYYFSRNFCEGKLSVDHRDLLINACDKEWIRFTSKNCKDLTAEDGWQIVTALWKSRLESSEKIKSADQRMDSLSDIFHGLGTSVVASCLAFVVWAIAAILWSTTGFSWGEIIVPIISITIIYTFYSNYMKTKNSLENIIKIILTEELRKEYEYKKKFFLKENPTLIIEYK